MEKDKFKPLFGEYLPHQLKELKEEHLLKSIKETKVKTIKNPQ